MGSFVAISLFFCSLAYADGCADALKLEREKALSSLNEALDLEELADELRISEEEVTSADGVGSAALLGIDPSHSFLSEDPFVNRVCYLAAYLTFESIKDSEGLSVSDWAVYRSDFLHATNPNEAKRFLRMSYGSDSYNRLYEQLIDEFYALNIFPVVEHYTVYSARLDILVDLTYRQFLFDRVSPEVFELLPTVFIGSLEEYRNLLAAHLSPREVEFLLFARQFEHTHKNRNPLLSEFLAGEKTYQDVPEPFVTDEDLVVESSDVQTSSAGSDSDDFVVVEPSPIVVIIEDE